LINAKVLNYLDESSFKEIYELIRQAERSLNGFMSHIRRQRAGAQEFGDKSIHEDQAEYVLIEEKDDSENQE